MCKKLSVRQDEWFWLEHLWNVLTLAVLHLYQSLWIVIFLFAALIIKVFDMSYWWMSSFFSFTKYNDSLQGILSKMYYISRVLELTVLWIYIPRTSFNFNHLIPCFLKSLLYMIHKHTSPPPSPHPFFNEFTFQGHVLILTI